MTDPRPRCLVSFLVAVATVASLGTAAVLPAAAAGPAGPSGSSGSPPHQVQGPRGPQTVLHCGTLIDGRSDTPLRDVLVAVNDGDGRIDAIFGMEDRDREIPDGMVTVDLSDATCLPGMIDMHVHLTVDPRGFTGVGTLGGSSADKAMIALWNAQKMLQHGFTTVRSPGEMDRHYSLVDVRDAIERGDFDGPRILVAPHAISPTGGHGDSNDYPPDRVLEADGLVVDGVDGMRRAIREEIKFGADWIKLMATGGVMSHGDNPNATAYSDEEMQAAVDETHRHFKKITVHALGPEGLKQAVRAGVDSVEHGILIDREGIELMLERGTTLVPTIYVLNYVVEVGPEIGYPEDSVRKGAELMEVRDDRIRAAFEAGVKVAMGSDTIFPVEQAAREFAQMVRLGLSPMDAIRAGTINAAELLGVDAEVGTIEPGKLADIVAVDGDPLVDVTVLENGVRFVMKSGRTVRNATHDEEH